MAKTKTATKRRTQSKPESSADEDVAVCRRRNERRGDEETLDEAPVAKSERRKVQRRRQIDPTTCERDYTPDEIEFMHALDDYKRASGRMFPTCSEILEVVRNLGYLKTTDHVGSAEVVESVDSTESGIEDAIESTETF